MVHIYSFYIHIYLFMVAEWSAPLPHKKKGLIPVQAFLCGVCVNLFYH